MMNRSDKRKKTETNRESEEVIEVARGQTPATTRIPKRRGRDKFTLDLSQLQEESPNATTTAT